MDKETLQIIASLRREQPRNPKTMHVCDELERIWREYKKIANEKMQQVEIVTKETCPDCEKRKKQTRDRVRRFRERTLA